MARCATYKSASQSGEAAPVRSEGASRTRTGSSAANSSKRQLELPPRIRGLGPFWADHAGPGLVPHTQALIAGLEEAVRQA